jgi:hypothetical protein
MANRAVLSSDLYSRPASDILEILQAPLPDVGEESPEESNFTIIRHPLGSTGVNGAEIKLKLIQKIA